MLCVHRQPADQICRANLNTGDGISKEKKKKKRKNGSAERHGPALGRISFCQENQFQCQEVNGVASAASILPLGHFVSL